MGIERTCSMCHGVGWVLEMQDITSTLVEMLPCPIPDCKYSGKGIILMSVDWAKFNGVAKHPQTGLVMSIFKCGGLNE